MRTTLLRLLKPASGAAASLALQAVGIKLYALVLGPTGIGTLGIIRQVVSLGTSAATLNSQTVLIQGFSHAEARQRFAATAAAIMLMATIAVALLIVAASPVIAHRAFPGGYRAATLAVAAAALPVATGAAFLFLSSLLIAVGRIGSAALAQTCGAVAFAAVAYPAASAALEGSAIAYLGSFVFGSLASASAALFLLGRELRKELARAFAPWHLDGTEARRYVGLSLAVVAAGALHAVILLTTRLLLADLHGLPAVGLFEAAWSSSTLLITVATGALTASQLPILSRARDAHELGRVTDHTVSAAVVFAVPGLVLMVALKPLFTRVLFSDDFLPMMQTWRWMLAADLVRIVGWALMLPLLATRRVRAYVLLEIGASAVLIGGFALALVRHEYRDALGAAYLAMTVMYASTAFAILWFSGISPLSRRTLFRLALGISMVSALSFHLWDVVRVTTPHLAVAVVMCAAYLATVRSDWRRQ